MCCYSDRIHRILSLRWWIPRAPANSGDTYQSHLSAHPLLPTYTFARQYGVAHLRTVQLSEYRLGKLRRAGSGRAKALVIEVLHVLIWSRGRSHQSRCIEIPFPDRLCRQSVYRLVLLGLANLTVERAGKAKIICCGRRRPGADRERTKTSTP